MIQTVEFLLLEAIHYFSVKPEIVHNNDNGSPIWLIGRDMLIYLEKDGIILGSAFVIRLLLRITITKVRMP